ncbi:hypothetical protein C3B58_12760 [Lactonifactor longoviformis]|uniref:Uncharacterized protein n=1 Tax=Lactonifactor longoviformis DSM 17459 TaxID=1122155 RepID=A0A1M5D6C3_9CLOT|nr:hypothetical protein [Lactonifactor longoviformis]POP32268.1 hypothetical protein C3B58_12760 [Lactonifactor longoviformis]SHF62242.1 hypothetical protein SAMN02745158_04421 [Lactonifactor longoviformis DSM 17459]
MDEKKIYAVYVDLLRLHKEFYGVIAFYNEREAFIQRLNLINSKHNSCFCYNMCEALRKWLWRGRAGLDSGSVSKYYADLWRFHHEYLGKVKTDEDYEKICNESHVLFSKYNFEECKDMILAIVADLDVNKKQQAGA